MSVWKRVIFIKELSNHVNSVFWNVFSLNYLLSAGPVAYIHHLLICLIKSLGQVLE